MYLVEIGDSVCNFDLITTIQRYDSGGKPAFALYFASTPGGHVAVSKDEEVAWLEQFLAVNKKTAQLPKP